MNATMKAIVQTKLGSPDVLQLQEVAKPVPADNEILIKVHATTVEAADALFRQGNDFAARLFTGLLKPKVTLPGSEFAGEIEAIGNAVTRFKVGDQVFGTTAPGFGAHAGYLCLPQDGVMAIKPTGLSYEETVSIHPGAFTALPNLRDTAHIQRGQKVLINGASGSVGSSAVQLAKYFGAEVTGVCSAANIDLVKSLGADKVIDYQQEDFIQTSETYNVIFDAVGKSSFSRCKSALKPGGHLSDHNRFADYFASDALDFQVRWQKARIVFAGLRSAIEKNKDLAIFLELVKAGKFKPVIDRCFPLEQMAEAPRYIDTGRKKGNVVISVLPGNWN